MSRGQSPSDVVIEFPLGGRRRQLRCSSLILGVTAGLFGLTTVGLIGGGYLIRDERHAAFADREKQAQRAYETRIAALQRRIDELVGGQLVDAHSVEGKVQNLVRRQAQLETRAAAVARLVERAVAGGVTAVARAARAEPLVTAREGIVATSSAPAPTPSGEGLDLRLGGASKPTPLPPSDPAPTPPDRHGRSAALMPATTDAPLSQRLQRVAASLDRVAQDQRQRLSGILRPALQEAARLRRIFEVAGVAVSRTAAETRLGRAESDAVGGPFVAAPEPDDASRRFENDLAQAQSAITTLEGLRRALPATPVRAPLAGPLQPTSSFGYRTDPFLGRPALHSGIDLRDSYGAPVRAAAGGVVTVAGQRGGYGNLVEVDHGDGMSTRYGHLSEIDVVPGEPVKPGATLGRVGSSGRSTGPHLHYEVRIDGEAVDPARFLEAAALLEDTK